MLYTALTLGAQAVSAVGVGVAKPPKGNPATAYVGVRLTRAELGDNALLDRIHLLGVSVVVDASAAQQRAAALQHLASEGVDIANGGWGHGSFLRWNRAHNDVTRASQLLQREAGVRAREFMPGRRVDAFDQFYSHKHKQKLVVADLSFGPEGLPARLQAGKVYLLEGRGRAPSAMEAAVKRLEVRFARAGLRAAPLGELR